MTDINCECGVTFDSMSHAVDHVTDEHNALDIATNTLITSREPELVRHE